MYAYDACMPSPLLDAEIVGELVRSRRIADAQRVKARRLELNLLQGQVAELAGINVSSLCRIESGTYTPKDEHKVRIAAALAREVHDLWKPLDITEVRERAIELSAA